MTAPATTPTELQDTIDRLSLEQALLDASIATNRAHDLAIRLVELQTVLADERAKNAALAERAEHVQRLYDEIVTNRAYGLATKVWTARRLIRG
jgi:hypothetical protein